MIISRTPFRVSLFGGGSDYPVHLKENYGAVLGGAINKYCYLTLRHLEQDFGAKYRIRYTYSESTSSIDGIQHPAVKAILTKYKIQQATEINHSSDLPARSGIGSSSSFIVGLIAALESYNEKKSSREIAKEAIDVEQNFLKESVGYQDAILASHGGFGLIEFPKNSLDFKFTPLQNEEYLEELCSNFLLIRTGDQQRIASTVAAEQIRTMRDNSSDLNELADIAKSSFHSMKKEEMDITTLSELLNYSWQIKKRQSGIISNVHVENLIQKCFVAGAMGTKLIGAGQAGFLLVIVPKEKQVEFCDSMKNHKIVRFSWSKSGVQAEKSFD